VDNIGDDWHNPLLQILFFNLTVPEAVDLIYSPVMKDRYLAVARSPASMVPASSPSKPRFPKEVGAAQIPSWLASRRRAPCLKPSWSLGSRCGPRVGRVSGRE